MKVTGLLHCFILELGSLRLLLLRVLYPHHAVWAVPGFHISAMARAVS